MPQFPDTQLKLGDFTFQNIEIPERISFGGEQRLVIHEYPGGDRHIQAMGREEIPIVWRGRFMGPFADSSAQTVDAMRIAGKEQVLTWGKFRYRVVIKTFTAEYERFYNIPYEISCQVIEDLGNPTSRGAPPGANEGIAAQKSTAQSLWDSIKNSDIIQGAKGLVDDALDAVGAVSDFVHAGIDDLNSVLQPVLEAQGFVQGAIADIGGGLVGITSLGGVFPNDVSGSILNLTTQAESFSVMGNLSGIDGALGNIANSVTGLMVGGSLLDPAAQSITTGAGNLYDLAAKFYGDATKWAQIADHNGLTDPQLDGIQTLDLPPNPMDTGGLIGG